MTANESPPPGNVTITFNISGTAELGQDYLISGLAGTPIGTCGGGSTCTAKAVIAGGAAANTQGGNSHVNLLHPPFWFLRPPSCCAARLNVRPPRFPGVPEQGFAPC
jgi:hypothetical protein